MADNTFGKENCVRAIRDMTNALNDATKEVANYVKNFAIDTSRVWNDPNAVDFMKEIKVSYEKAIKEMNKNNKKFAEAASKITTIYLRTSDDDYHGRFSADPPFDVSATIDVSAVKASFPDGLVGSRMKEGETLTDHMKRAESKLSALADQVEASVKNANAFSNPSVKAAFGRTASKVAKILRDHAQDITKISKKYIDDTAQNYTMVSEASADMLIQMISSTDGGK